MLQPDLELAVSRSQEKLQPLFELLEQHVGLVDGIWMDPYVLGFVTSVNHAVARHWIADRLSREDLDKVLAKLFERLARVDGSVEVQEVHRLGASRNDLFWKGMNEGLVVLLQITGWGDVSDEELVSELRETLSKGQDVGPHLLLNTIVKRAREIRPLS